ncbi:HET-domain-containing protein [Podospora australis]|uniref:HET-domain-containing protein n=1 Tax=Podospora australis TaxID=1536484 RepID=A0AAN7ADQ3_9PEZI|nr:HET-domain-containing protein [Podospora australis]
MRLLHVKTLKMRDFPKEPPLYAILPHTWGDEEVSLQEFASDDRETKKGFAKIKGCCRQAHSDGLDWVWIDTCCIDKTSSVELSEVINSMYAWYRDSQVCYAFLDDIPTGHLVHVPGKFPNARWFTRGWCLQELIAPSTVEFYAADWSEIGTKHSLADRICNITRVPEKCCIAEEMSWASGRKTTRVEDEAFCLLGIFGVNMPMLYGEGQNAFFRLQEEMLKHTEDYTFLLRHHYNRETKNHLELVRQGR